MDFDPMSWVPAGGAGGAFMAWLIRLEAKLKAAHDKSDENKSEIDKIKTKQDVLIGKISEDLSRVRESIARIEGQLASHKE